MLTQGDPLPSISFWITPWTVDNVVKLYFYPGTTKFDENEKCNENKAIRGDEDDKPVSKLKLKKSNYNS